MLTEAELHELLDDDSRPNGCVEDYEARVLELLLDHALPIRWSALHVPHGGHTAQVFVTPDAVRVPVRRGDTGDVTLWRPAVSALVAQQFADELGAILLTTHVADMICDQASKRIEPQTDPSVPCDLAGQLAHTDRCDRALAQSRGLAGIVEGVGKHWVIDDSLRAQPPATACNYGWYSASAPYTSASGYRMWQTRGWRHDLHHWDYSQTLRLMADRMLVEDSWTDTRAVGSDQELYPLLSSRGPIDLWRQRGVPGGDDPKEPSLLTYERLLLLATPLQSGPDVDAWRAFLELPSGHFDLQADGLTREYQRERGLKPDGKVGQLTIAQANEDIQSGRGAA